MCSLQKHLEDANIQKNQQVSILLYFLFFFFIDCKEREKKRSSCCSIYLCTHWLLFICALTRDQTHNLGLSGQHSNQQSYPARVMYFHIYHCDGYFHVSTWLGHAAQMLSQRSASLDISVNVFFKMYLRFKSVDFE